MRKLQEGEEEVLGWIASLGMGSEDEEVRNIILGELFYSFGCSYSLGLVSTGFGGRMLRGYLMNFRLAPLTLNFQESLRVKGLLLTHTSTFCSLFSGKGSF